MCFPEGAGNLHRIFMYILKGAGNLPRISMYILKGVGNFVQVISWKITYTKLPTRSESGGESKM